MLKLLNSILEKALSDKSQLVLWLTTAFLAGGIANLAALVKITGLTIEENQIVKTQAQLIPWLFVLALSLSYYLFYRRVKTFRNLKNWKLYKKIKLTVGDYYEVTCEGATKPIKITLKSISSQEHSATVGFIDLSGREMYHGEHVKKLPRSLSSNEENFSMPETTYMEQEHSVFSFRPDNSIYASNPENSGCFFACCVSHINPTAQEVELNIYYLWVKYA